MPLFQYKAKDKMGNEIKGTIDAQNERGAIDSLRGKNIFVVTIARHDKDKFVKRGRGIKRKDIVAFSRQLATMVNAGLPILESLNILYNQTEKLGMKDVLNNVIQKIESGFALADAFALHRKVFGTLFISMISAGESSGKLPLILNRVAGYLEGIDSLQRKVKSAMMYPVIVTSACIAITLFLIMNVIPVFAKMYADFGGALPAPTRVLIIISDILRKWFLLIAIGAGIGAYLLKRWSATPMGRMVVDRAKLKMPIFGILINKIVISRFAKTLSVLIMSGIPILNALELIKGVVDNKVVEAALDKTAKAVRQGEGIATPLATCPVFPMMIVKMIEVGEKTGNLEEMLDKMSEYYDDEVNTTISGLTSLIEPLLILFLGVVIGGVMICMFLPIFKLATIIQG